MNFEYELFLDDIRLPLRPDPGVIPPPLVVCRTAKAFRDTVSAIGYPKFIYFDNDLGEEEEGRHLATWLLDRIVTDIEAGLQVPEINWSVHSMNPIGKEAIEHTMRSIRTLCEKRSKQTGV